MRGGAIGRGLPIGTWLGIATVWGAVALLVVVADVEPRVWILIVSAAIAIVAAVLVSLRHGTPKRRATITPRDLRRR